MKLVQTNTRLYVKCLILLPFSGGLTRSVVVFLSSTRCNRTLLLVLLRSYAVLELLVLNVLMLYVRATGIRWLETLIMNSLHANCEQSWMTLLEKIMLRMFYTCSLSAHDVTVHMSCLSAVAFFSSRPITGVPRAPLSCCSSLSEFLSSPYAYDSESFFFVIVPR